MLMNVRILFSYVHVQHHFRKLFPSYKYIYLTAFYVICAHYAARKENPFQRRNSLSLKTLQCSKEVVGDGGDSNFTILFISIYGNCQNKSLKLNKFPLRTFCFPGEAEKAHMVKKTTTVGDEEYKGDENEK